jgi:hypothetical protein
VLALGVLSAVPMRTAQAGQEFRFRRVFTLSEANLQSFDLNDAFWNFSRGELVVEVSGSIGDHGDCFVSVAGFGSGSGLNYKTGTGASLSVFLFGSGQCQTDPTGSTIEVKVPMDVMLSGTGGGSLPSRMTLRISASGVEIAGVTIGIHDDE